ncbi:hypothetical protein AoKodu_19770 [Actinomyces oris K20]|nr:hypothetical protein AoKodu_19770 [Actinomyces oris K20]
MGAGPLLPGKRHKGHEGGDHVPQGAQGPACTGPGDDGVGQFALPPGLRRDRRELLRRAVSRASQKDQDSP